MADLVVSYTREGDKQVIDTQSSIMGTIDVDYTGVPEDARGGTAKQLLASSALYCFCGAFAKALEVRGASYEKIYGTATLHTGLDEMKRARVTGIDIEVTVEMDEEHEFTFDRVEKIMKQGCLITASLEAAFPMKYTLHHEY